MADAADLKSAGDSSPCRFESGPRQGEDGTLGYFRLCAGTRDL